MIPPEQDRQDLGAHARLSLSRKLFFAVLAAVLWLAGLELLLRLLPELYSPDRVVTLANNQAPSEPVFFDATLRAFLSQGTADQGQGGEAAALPVLEGLGGNARFFLPRLDMHPRPFPVHKPLGGLRIVVLGSSAAHGFGMSQNGAFAHRLQQLLEPLYPRRMIEVLNLGVVAWSSQQHLWLARRVLEPLAPDLLILYAGNNELAEAATVRRYFPPERYRRWLQVTGLERSLSQLRLFVLLRGLASSAQKRGEGADSALPLTDLPRLEDAQVARLDSVARDFAAQNFALNVGRMAALAEQAHVPLVLMTVGANLRTPPFGFPPPAGVADAFHMRMQEAEAQEVHNNPEALRLYQEAEALYDSPLVHFRQARVLEGLQRLPEAREALKRARDRSEHPNRAPTVVQETIRAVAQQYNLLLVDGERVLEQAAPDGIPGYELVYDYCHPTLQGHWLLAKALATALVQARLLEPPDAADEGALRGETLFRAWETDFQARRIDYDDLEEWLGIDLSTRPEVYYGDSRPPMIERFKALQAALAEGVTAEKLVALGNAAYLTSWRSGERSLAGTPLLALQSWQAALTLAPERCGVHGNLGIALATLGEYKAAQAELRKAQDCDPHSARWRRWLTRMRQQLEAP